MENDNYPMQPQQPIRVNEETAPVMSFGEWLVTLLIISVPLLNLIMLFVWAMDRNANPNKANWAKASLVIIAIQIVLAMFFIGIMIGSISQFISGFEQTPTW